MKKILVIALLTSIVAMPSFAAEKARGGFVGGIYGCCFGLRGAAAYNDGKDVIAMEWVDALVTCHIWAFIQGWSGTTTEDLRQSYGTRFF